MSETTIQQCSNMFHNRVSEVIAVIKHDHHRRETQRTRMNRRPITKLDLQGCLLEKTVEAETSNYDESELVRPRSERLLRQELILEAVPIVSMRLIRLLDGP